MPVNNLPRRVIWSMFLDAFVVSVKGGAVIAAQKHVVAWRRGNALNHLELLNFSWPSARSLDAPRITRISVNKHVFIPPTTILRNLGFDKQRPLPRGSEGLHLEWTILGNELLAFADWLPVWVEGRLDPNSPIPLPPHPSHVFGKGLRTTDYAWTATAWDTYGRWKRDDNTLPHPYAIHAQDVVPAAPEPQAEHPSGCSPQTPSRR
jgi:hypothetical protein